MALNSTQRGLTGFAAGLAAAFAMNLFARAASSRPGDRRGHGVQPPQGHRPGDDATVRVGTALFRAATNANPNSPTRQRLGTLVHYLFGGAVGAGYTLCAARFPSIRAGHGMAYGIAVWIVADEVALPALGLSRGGAELPPRVHAYALAGHCVYGVVLDRVTELVASAPSSVPPQRAPLALARERGLDQTIESSFPASDPPSSNPAPEVDALPDSETRETP